jgi:hypothetical protein
MDARKFVRARYPRSRACRFPDVLAGERGGVQMRGYWVIYPTKRAGRKLGRGSDEAAAWRDAAARVLAEEG